MKRDRFRAILSFFHLNDNTGYIPANQPNHDPLYKLRPLVDHLKMRFKAVYTPTEKVCITEALCPWRGRAGMKVYMKDKPTKWGIKVYELCESSSGYVWDFEVMCKMPGLSNKPFYVCHRLMKPLKQQGYILYVDDHYCSPHLVDSLVAENTMVVGIVRPNCLEMPQDLVVRGRGDVDYRRRHQTVALLWRDKQDVHLLTTHHGPQMQEVATRTERKLKPVAVIDYNEGMSGVHLSDQLLSYLPLHRRTFKWWKKLAFHLLTLAMIQAFILYNKFRQANDQQRWKLDHFVRDVCEGIARMTPADADTPDTSVGVTDIDRLTGRHFLEMIDQEKKEKGQRHKRLSCVVHYARAVAANVSRADLKNKAVKTLYRCKQCKKPLCPDVCFEAYHTKKKYA